MLPYMSMIRVDCIRLLGSFVCSITFVCLLDSEHQRKHGITYFSLGDWLVLSTMVISSSIQFPGSDIISFFFVAKYDCIVCVKNSQIIYSSFDMHPGLFNSVSVVHCTQCQNRYRCVDTCIGICMFIFLCMYPK